MSRQWVKRRFAVDTGFHPDRLNMAFAAQVAAGMYLGAAVAALLLAFAPDGVSAQRPVSLGLAAASLAGATVWFVVFDRAPSWLLYGGTAFGTAIISVGAVTVEATGQGVALYVWGVIYAFVFFPRRVAAYYLAGVCTTYAVVLRLSATQDATFATWLLAALTLIAVGLVIGALRDRLAVELRHSEVQARTDALTGLPNRRALVDDLDAALASGVPHRLVLCDLNGFKTFNDTLGHQEGDRLLERLGSQLQHLVGDAGHAYRLGGDEFCVLLPVDGELTVADVERALCDQATNVAITAAPGAVELLTEARDADTALRIADARMYACKGARARGVRAA